MADQMAIDTIRFPHYKAKGVALEMYPGIRWVVAERDGHIRACCGLLSDLNHGVRWVIDLLGTDARALNELREWVEKEADEEEMPLVGHVSIDSPYTKYVLAHGYLPVSMLVRREPKWGQQ